MRTRYFTLQEPRERSSNLQPRQASSVPSRPLRLKLSVLCVYSRTCQRKAANAMAPALFNAKAAKGRRQERKGANEIFYSTRVSLTVKQHSNINKLFWFPSCPLRLKLRVLCVNSRTCQREAANALTPALFNAKAADGRRQETQRLQLRAFAHSWPIRRHYLLPIWRRGLMRAGGFRTFRRRSTNRRVRPRSSRPARCNGY